MTLRELRRLYSLSLEDVARMTGVAWSAIERMDAGRPVKPDEAMNVRLKLTIALSTPLPSSILHISIIGAGV